MEDTHETKTTGRKRGRPPAPGRSNLVKITMSLDPDDTEWAKGQEGGLSGMVRRLLRQARLTAEKGEGQS